MKVSKLPPKLRALFDEEVEKQKSEIIDDSVSSSLVWSRTENGGRFWNDVYEAQSISDLPSPYHIVEDTEDRLTELVEKARNRYKDAELVTSLPGRYIDFSGKFREPSDGNFRVNYHNDETDFIQDRRFHYDPVEDTLCNWGRGIGLIYRKGQWAGEEVKEKSDEINNSYQIF